MMDRRWDYFVGEFAFWAGNFEEWRGFSFFFVIGSGDGFLGGGGVNLLLSVLFDPGALIGGILVLLRAVAVFLSIEILLCSGGVLIDLLN